MQVARWCMRKNEVLYIKSICSIDNSPGTDKRVECGKGTGRPPEKYPFTLIKQCSMGFYDQGQPHARKKRVGADQRSSTSVSIESDRSQKDERIADGLRQFWCNSQKRMKHWRDIVRELCHASQHDSITF